MENYNSKFKTDEMDTFCKAILRLSTLEECYKFFDDICTINEMQALGQRLQVAKMLREKKTYQDISTITGASTATISRVNRCLNYGSGGYKIVLDRFDEDSDL